MKLSLSDLRRLDPGAQPRVETAFICPSPECIGHRRRTLYANTQTGFWFCQRCNEKGRLREWWEKPTERRQRLQRELHQRQDLAFSDDPINQIVAQAKGDVHAAINGLHQYQHSVECLPFHDGGPWEERHRYHAFIRRELNEIHRTISTLARKAILTEAP